MALNGKVRGRIPRPVFQWELQEALEFAVPKDFASVQLHKRPSITGRTHARWTEAFQVAWRGVWKHFDKQEQTAMLHHWASAQNHLIVLIDDPDLWKRLSRLGGGRSRITGFCTAMGRLVYVDAYALAQSKGFMDLHGNLVQLADTLAHELVHVLYYATHTCAEMASAPHDARETFAYARGDKITNQLLEDKDFLTATDELAARIIPKTKQDLAFERSLRKMAKGFSRELFANGRATNKTKPAGTATHRAKARRQGSPVTCV